MTDLDMTVLELAQKAQVDPSTVRNFIDGKHWPRDETRRRIAEALGWQMGDIARIALSGHVPLADVSTADLLEELCHRFRKNPAIL